MPYARQVVTHLLRLVKQLFIIGQVLPPAASADPEMPAGRLSPVGRWRDNLQGHTLHIPLLFFRDPDINHIARDHSGYEEDHVINPGDGIAF